MPTPTNRPDSSDRELLTIWATTQDEGAFHALVVRYLAQVQSAASRYGSPDGDEAVQATFLLMSERAGALADHRHLATWLTQAARRIVANQRRMSSRRKRHEKEAAMVFAQQKDNEASATVLTDAKGLLDEALATLSPGRREAVVRYYIEQRAPADIAAELGCTAEAIRTRVHESMGTLREFFRRRGVPFGVVAIAAGLAESVGAEANLIDACCRAATVPSSMPKVAVLAHITLKGMVLAKTFAVVGGGLLAGAIGTGAYLTLASAPSKAPSVSNLSMEPAASSESDTHLVMPEPTDPNPQNDVPIAEPPQAVLPTIHPAVISKQVCHPGESFSITYTWDAEPMDQDYWAFVHIRRPDNLIVRQDDHFPHPGTSRWQGTIAYSRTIDMPMSATPGVYSIMSGLWFMKDGENTKWTLNTAPGLEPDPQGYYQVGSITVVAP